MSRRKIIPLKDNRKLVSPYRQVKIVFKKKDVIKTKDNSNGIKLNKKKTNYIT